MKTWAWFLVLMLVLPSPVMAYHDGTSEPHTRDKICFTTEEANKVLKTLENHDRLILDVSDCEGLISDCENMVTTCNEQLEWNSNEILVLIGQRQEAVQMLDEAQKAAKIAKKGTWWERIKSNSRWLSYGVIIGGAIVGVLTR